MLGLYPCFTEHDELSLAILQPATLQTDRGDGKGHRGWYRDRERKKEGGVNIDRLEIGEMGNGKGHSG